ncbi:MAG: hypothetical protein LAT50_16920 [Ectothiorhodospiraceae bacterium]|nr:hypothetical protein [Ectothiorhodospiraceae bacterium]
MGRCHEAGAQDWEGQDREGQATGDTALGRTHERGFEVGMAGDWIKMRVNLRKHPKVIAMARHLGGRRDFMDWWSDPVRKTCKDHVTELVTFTNVTRVTVCGLLEAWGAINAVIKEEDHVPYMELIDLDDITGIPGFGEAMEAVGWADEHEENGLVFSNFREFNTPESSRKNAKTGAERAREYRQRKKAEAENNERHERHETSHREEKRRDIPPVVPQGTRFDDFWQAYPNKTGKKPALEKWKRKKLDALADQIITDVLTRIEQHKPWSDGFIPNPATYLHQERWTAEIQPASAVVPIRKRNEL